MRAIQPAQPIPRRRAWTERTVHEREWVGIAGEYTRKDDVGPGPPRPGVDVAGVPSLLHVDPQAAEVARDELPCV
jgi:hypothetical protein